MAADKMRIAMLSVHSCPVGKLGARDTGGMSVYIRELSLELGKRGLPVDIYTRVHDPGDSQVLPLGQNVRLIHLRAGDDEDMHKLAVYSFLPDFACNVENFRKNDGIQYSLVFSHYWLSGWVGKWLQQWWKVPHLVMFHTLGAVKNAVGIGEDEPELRVEAEGQLARDCHRIIAATKKEKDELVRHYGASPGRIGVVPCGVDLELFQPMDKELAKKRLNFDNDKVILFVGRIEPLKGIDRLLEATSYLQDGRRLKLLIVGGDEHSQEEVTRLKTLSRSLHMEGLVSYSGVVNHEDMPYIYSAADVCVVPSYYESFGLVALESIACGTPVVAADVGGFRGIVRQGATGYVVTGGTPHCFADKIAVLLSRPDPDAEILQAMRTSVARFGWSNIAQAIIQQCKRALADYPSMEQ